MQGFEPLLGPDVVRQSVASACGFQPRSEADAPMFLLDEQHADGAGGLCLAGTAEVPIAGTNLSNLVDE